MALFRHVRTEFWRDAKVLEEMTPEDKLFFLYILTNANTTQIGIYKILKKEMAFELGYSVETINALMDRFENNYKLIKYNQETRELAVKHWGKYNLVKGGKPIFDCIRKEIKEVKDKTLLAYVAEFIYKEDIKEEFYKYIDDSYDQSLPSTINTKEENFKEDNYDISMFKKLYEQNVGLINGIVAQWLVETAENIDYELFKKAIEIATDKGKCNKGYINGIIKQWNDNNIRSYSEFEVYEKSLNRGGNNGRDNNKYRKHEFTKWDETEDEELYRKPTSEEIAAVEKQFNDFRN